MTNREIAQIFRDMSIYLAMSDDRFKARAHERAADTIESMSQSVETIYQDGGTKALISTIEGVGAGLAADIQEIITTGKLAEHAKLAKQWPIDIAQLSRVEGLGPKSLATLYTELKIKTVDDLRTAAQSGAIQALSGFGKKSEEHILASLDFLSKSGNRFLISDVMPIAQLIVQRLQSVPGTKKIEIAGSLRRMKETIGDIDLVAVSSHPKALMEYFVSMKDVVQIQEQGATRSMVRLSQGFDCDLRVVPSQDFGAALVYFTGSKDHVVDLRKRALSKGLTLNEYGLYHGTAKTKQGDPVASATEKDVYRHLGLSWIEPELREGSEIIELAEKKTLPKIIGYDELCGDLQVQTDWTDGAASIEEMALAAQRKGLSYIAITDHTKTLTVAGGLDEKKLDKQSNMIDRLNDKLKGITILKGAEVNILKDGSLDISDGALRRLDMVGISIHSNFNLSKEEQTKRMITAMSNPYVNVVFHPTGRRINKREGYDIDMDAICKAAVKYNVIMEINAQAERLDLNDQHIRLALSYGVRFSIDSDSHSTDGFDHLVYGIGQARRGGVSVEHIVNAKSLKELRKILRSKR